MCPPPAGVLSTAPQVSRDAMGWCERHLLVSLRPDPNPDANPHLELERQQSVATPPGREKTRSPTLQTHQDPILLQPWLWFEAQGARALLYMPLAVIIGSRCPPHAYAEE
jgi:hypothetical protein